MTSVIIYCLYFRGRYILYCCKHSYFLNITVFCFFTTQTLEINISTVDKT